MNSELIYRRTLPTVLTCTLEGAEIVFSDASSVTRLEKSGAVILIVAETCAESGLELGDLGKKLRTKWLAHRRVNTTRVMEEPDFDPETVGKVVGRELHVEISRAGHADHNKFCTDLLERPIISLALLTLEEACAVRDALLNNETSYLEHYHSPSLEQSGFYDA